MSKLTHFNEQGTAHMVDIGKKAVTHRLAIASGIINMKAETLSLIKKKSHKKGDVLAIARVAGIMGAKKNKRTRSTLPPSFINSY
jgi:cyclic pyranopterin phosphate synthase